MKASEETVRTTTVEVTVASRDEAKRAIIGTGLTLKEFASEALMQHAATPTPRKQTNHKSIAKRNG